MPAKKIIQGLTTALALLIGAGAHAVTLQIDQNSNICADTPLGDGDCTVGPAQVVSADFQFNDPAAVTDQTFNLFFDADASSAGLAVTTAIDLNGFNGTVDVFGNVGGSFVSLTGGAVNVSPVVALVLDFDIAASPPANLLRIILTGINGAEELAVSITAVPLPAAAWMFFSAIAGLVVVGRRRLQTA